MKPSEADLFRLINKFTHFICFTGKNGPIAGTILCGPEHQKERGELRAQNQRISTLKQIYAEDLLELQRITKQVEDHEFKN